MAHRRVPRRSPAAERGPGAPGIYLDSPRGAHPGERERRRLPLCFKGEGTLAREEVETDISAELFRRLTAFTGQDLVTKDYRVYALPGGERLEVSLVDAGRPTAFFYAEVEFPTVEAARAFVPPPFLGEEKTESGDFSMSAYWHATRGSGREG